MRYGNSGQTRTHQIASGVGPLLVAALGMFACTGVVYADTLPETGGPNGDAYLVAAVNNWAPEIERWQLRTAKELQLTEVDSEGIKEVEEITVVAKSQGTRMALELERRRLERMREAMYAELRLRERGNEEAAWRQADPDLENSESRIKWGYSAQADYRMRRDNALVLALPLQQVKPASVIRIDF